MAPVVAANNPLLNPNQTLSGNALLQAAQGLAQAQTAPVLQQLAQEIAQNNTQSQGAENLTGGYFNQLGQQAQQGLTAEQGIQSGLNSQLAGLQSNETNQLQGIGNDALASFAKYAPGTAGAAGASALASEIARQQGLAAQQNGAMSAFGANQGANYSGLAASNLGSFGMRGQEDLNQIAQAGQIKNAPLVQKEATENATYGADLATALGKLRQQEITNQISDAGLGIKQAAVNATVGDNERTTSTSAANNQRTTATSSANNQRTTAQSNLNNQRTTSTSAANNAANNAIKQAELNAKTGAGATKPLTAIANNTYLNQLSTVQQLIKDGQGKNLSEAQIKANLQDGANPSKKSYSATQVQAAYELLGWGHITPQTAAALHSSGVRGGTYNGAPIKVAPAPAPSGGFGVPGLAQGVSQALGSL